MTGRSSADHERVASRAIEISPVEVRSLLAAIDEPRILWSDPDGETIVAWGTAVSLTASGPGRFETIRNAADRLFEATTVDVDDRSARPRLFGGFAFYDEDGERPPWQNFPDARFVLPRAQVTITDEGTWLTVTAAGGTDARGSDGPSALEETIETRVTETRRWLESIDESATATDGAILREPTQYERPGIRETHRTTTLEGWRETVTEATARIEAGELEKVVLAQALEATLETELSIPDVLARLDHKYPDCFRFLIEPADVASSPVAFAPIDGDGSIDSDASVDDERWSFFGASPERLVSLRGRTVETDVLAGTTGRGDTPAEDDWLAEELRTDPKNSHEHELVAETVRDQLEPYAATISVGGRRVKRLATVQHLHTPITAKLAADEHVLSLVEALHPTPAVGGLPPEVALETIRRTERFDRGWYAAPVGWIDAAGDGTFAVALRSAAARQNVARLFAGVGIVADSDPDAEWDEVELKYRPILDELERPD